jgi:hypothetical protein
MSLPSLQVLTFLHVYPFHVEAYYDLPSLKHLSIPGAYCPRQLLHKCGPSLESLLFQYSAPTIDSAFWDHYASLRTLGLYPYTNLKVVSPPPDHPLRHLCLFFSHHKRDRITRIREVIANFPRIRRLSLRIQNISTSEKTSLSKVVAGLEVDFLGFLS